MTETKIDTYRRTPINAERMTIKNEITAWGHNVLIGKFYLKGNNPINENGLWPLLQKVKSEEGWCALVNQAEIFCVATISSLVTNDTGEIESVKVDFVNRWGGNSDAGKEDEGEELTDPKEFAILLNNMDRIGNFSGSTKGLNFLDAIYQSAAFDLEVSRPRIFVETHFYPNPEQKRRIKEQLDSFNMIVYASLGDGKPMTFHPWLPESKQPVLKSMWDWQFGLFRRFNGLAYNTSKKEERHNVAEIKMVEEQFESFENIWQQEIEYFLRKCYENFRGEEYTLMRDGEVVFQIGDIFKEEKKNSNGDGDQDNMKSENKEEKIDEININKNNE